MSHRQDGLSLSHAPLSRPGETLTYLPGVHCTHCTHCTHCLYTVQSLSLSVSPGSTDVPLLTIINTNFALPQHVSPGLFYQEYQIFIRYSNSKKNSLTKIIKILVFLYYVDKFIIFFYVFVEDTDSRYCQMSTSPSHPPCCS